MLRARRFWLVVALLLIAAGGCSKRRSAPIVQHPEWSYDDYQRIAVLPFKASRREAFEPARQAEYRLVDLLAGNGAFQVSARGDYRDIVTEQDLSRLADVADPSTILPEGMLEIAQALVIGSITECDLIVERIPRRIARHARDRKGRVLRDRRGRPIIVGYDEFIEYRHKARVGGNVRVVDAATGRLLFSHSVPAIENDDFRRGSPPGASPEDLAVAAAQEIATEFYRKIAPQRVMVKLDGDCLLVATDYYEGRYDNSSKLPRTLDEFLLVARGLPSACDRNNFRMAISPKDEHTYLVDHAFTWSPNLGPRGEAIGVPMSALTVTGAEEFTAKLFAAGNAEPIIERDFKLIDPKDD